MVSGTHIAGDFNGLNGSTLKLQLRNSDTHSEFVGKCRLHRGRHNIDYRSIPQFPPRVLCVQTTKSRKTLSFDKVSVVYLQDKQFLSKKEDKTSWH